MTEVWRQIPGWEDYYEISDAGRVRSLDRKVHRQGGVYMRLKGKVLVSAKTPGGYWQVVLSQDGLHVNYSIHRGVLIAFISECPAGMVGCHNDGNQSNNSLSNLRWDTQSNNLLDKGAHGNGQFGESNPCAILTDAQVDEIRVKLRTKTRGIGRQLAKEYGVSPSIISAINVGKRRAIAISTH